MFAVAVPLLFRLEAWAVQTVVTSDVSRVLLVLRGRLQVEMRQVTAVDGHLHLKASVDDTLRDCADIVVDVPGDIQHFVVPGGIHLNFHGVTKVLAHMSKVLSDIKGGTERVVVDSCLTPHCLSDQQREVVMYPVTQPRFMWGAELVHCRGGSFTRGWRTPCEHRGLAVYVTEFGPGDVIVTAGNDLYHAGSASELRDQMLRVRTAGAKIVYLAGFRRGAATGYLDR